MKFNLAHSLGTCRAFRRFFHARHRSIRPGPQPAPAPRRPHSEPAAEAIATFGDADLIRHRDGHWELRGGSPVEHAAAREWSSLFRHEAVFYSQPLPAATSPIGLSHAFDQPPSQPSRPRPAKSTATHEKDPLTENFRQHHTPVRP